MGKKIRAAKASLVAAFLAAGGAATATGMHASSTKATANTIGGTSVNWGDPLIRFIKLDGFPDFMKERGSEQLAQFIKGELMSDAATLYDKYPDQVAGLLDLYQKANAGPLGGILIGLEQFWKQDNAQAMLDYLKTPDGMANYVKFQDFFSSLQAVDGEKQGAALNLFIKETGIRSAPSFGNTDGGGDGGQLT